jgi:hypothetical protein
MPYALSPMRDFQSPRLLVFSLLVAEATRLPQGHLHFVTVSVGRLGDLSTASPPGRSARLSFSLLLRNVLSHH